MGTLVTHSQQCPGCPLLSCLPSADHAALVTADSRSGWPGQEKPNLRADLSPDNTPVPGSIICAIAVLFIVILTFPLMLSAAERPPKHPFFADSVYPIGHGDAAQQDALPVPGPINPGPVIAPQLIDYAASGPAQFGAYTSGPYPDGRRVLWANGLDRVVKIDYDTFEILATHWFDDVPRWTTADADSAIQTFDSSNEGAGAIWHAFQEAAKLREIAGVYTLLDLDNTYYIANKNGSITAYADLNTGHPASPIVEKRSFSLPAEVTGYTVGMNMTYDGWLIVPTEHGFLVAVSRDFEVAYTTRLQHSDDAENKATRPTGYGWVRNSIAIDVDGGIYVASQDHLHKVIWTGAGFSHHPADGAWSTPYLNSWGHGTGATPSLMGFGEEDQFVVITDGEPLMNVVLFWRNEIPDNWAGIPGLPRRIAGLKPADMGHPDLLQIQSEQAVVVAGYGAMVVNNEPRNIPWWLPEQAQRLLISYLGSAPLYQPYGIQKFVWNPGNRRLEQAWVNTAVSSPSCVPVVSHISDRVYLIGARNNRWTLEAIDWQTGESAYHSIIGGQRYNPIYSGTLLDEAGRIHYGGPWGRIRLNIASESQPP